MGHQRRHEQFRAALHQFFRRVPLWVWLIACLGVAAFYVIVWPSATAPATPLDLRYVVLRWFHPLAWILLAASIVLRMTNLPNKTRLANGVALLAVPTYASFFLAVATAGP